MKRPNFFNRALPTRRERLQAAKVAFGLGVIAVGIIWAGDKVVNYDDKPRPTPPNATAMPNMGLSCEVSEVGQESEAEAFVSVRQADGDPVTDASVYRVQVRNDQTNREDAEQILVADATTDPTKYTFPVEGNTDQEIAIYAANGGVVTLCGAIALGSAQTGDERILDRSTFPGQL